MFLETWQRKSWVITQRSLLQSDGQGGLACCSPWGCKESDTTEWLNWTELTSGLRKEGKIQRHIYKRILKGCISQYSRGVLFSSVQSLSCVQLFATPWTAGRQVSLSIINSQSLLKLMSIVSVMPPNYLILCRPLLLLPSIFPSIRVFSNESALCIR